MNPTIADLWGRSWLPLWFSSVSTPSMLSSGWVVGPWCCLARWEPHRGQSNTHRRHFGFLQLHLSWPAFWPIQSHLFCLQGTSLLWPLLRATGTRLKYEICNISDDVSSHFPPILPQTESQQQGSKSIFNSMSLKIFCQWAHLLVILSGVNVPDLLLLPCLCPRANEEGCPSCISD